MVVRILRKKGYNAVVIREQSGIPGGGEGAMMRAGFGLVRGKTLLYFDRMGKVTKKTPLP